MEIAFTTNNTEEKRTIRPLSIMSKVHRISCRLTDAEKEEFDKKVNKSNLSQSGFVRHCLFNPDLIVVAAPPKKTVDKKKLLFFYSKASNNLNQLAHQANRMNLSGELSAVQLDNILAELITIRSLLKSGVDNVD
ncbi:plasmid mobilization relaxosome protein MobC [Photobacterium toruni]|uniref:plasmid mobilization protein n=1 Tax=Photobacterium toruni TaxID=1935446 RepID=UPI002E19029D|nr:plasmid mobilization relaxosome protein MobC [Photobacterium toruni]